MSGIIEFYKIDKLKIENSLLPLISNEEFLKVFKEIILSYNSQTTYEEIFYEEVLKKIKTDFFKINHTEFQLILDWICNYYEDEFESDPKFLDNLGLLEIGDLHSREEATIFYFFGIYVLNKSRNIDLQSPLNSNDFKSVLDFLILILSKIILKDREIDDSYRNELEVTLVFLSKNEELNLKANEFLKNISDKNDFTSSYNDQIIYMIECAEALFDKLTSLRENIENYNGLIYRRDWF